MTEPAAEPFIDLGLEILTEPESRQLLEEATVGRVVVVSGAVAAVFPVNYCVVGGDIVFFTASGTKMRAAEEGAVVSFEVDCVDVERRLGWSVLVVGPATLASRSLAQQAEARGVYAWAAGGRSHAVRIRPEMITGRRIC